MVGKEEYTKGRIAGGWVHISRGKMPIALVHPKYVDKFLAVPDLYEAGKDALDIFIQHDATKGVVSGISLKLNEAIAKADGK